MPPSAIPTPAAPPVLRRRLRTASCACWRASRGGDLPPLSASGASGPAARRGAPGARQAPTNAAGCTRKEPPKPRTRRSGPNRRTGRAGARRPAAFPQGRPRAAATRRRAPGQGHKAPQGPRGRRHVRTAHAPRKTAMESAASTTRSAFPTKSRTWPSTHPTAR